MSRWNSLYIPLISQNSSTSDHTTLINRAEAIVTALHSLLSAAPYSPYDPFGLFPDKSYPQAAKLFVAPVNAGDTWLKILAAEDSAPPERIAQQLSAAASAICLYALLDGTRGDITAYQNGEPVDFFVTMTPYTQAYAQPDGEALRQALSITTVPNAKNKDDNALPMTALSADMRSMAGTLNQRQVNNMYARMSRHLMSKEQRAAAQSLLVASAPDWESAGGYKLRAVMACLGLPDGWMHPDYVLLRDAYQAHTRRKRNPNAHLLPGSGEAMEAVPDALAYRPFFAGIVEVGS